MNSSASPSRQHADHASTHTVVSVSSFQGRYFVEDSLHVSAFQQCRSALPRCLLVQLPSQHLARNHWLWVRKTMHLDA